jgi:hypothetical protein
MSIPNKRWLFTFPGTKRARLTNATENDVQDYDKACVRCFEMLLDGDYLTRTESVVQEYWESCQGGSREVAEEEALLTTPERM